MKSKTVQIKLSLLKIKHNSFNIESIKLLYFFVIASTIIIASYYHIIPDLEVLFYCVIFFTVFFGLYSYYSTRRIMKQIEDMMKLLEENKPECF